MTTKNTIGNFLQDSNGTVSLPSISFSSDPDTGLYRIGENNLGFTAGGVKVGEYSSAGAWTLGPTSGTLVHKIQSGNTDFQIIGTGASSNQVLDFIANGVSTFNIASGPGLGTTWFRTNNSTVVAGQVSTAGAWTLGASSGSVLTHTVQGGDSTQGVRVNFLSNHATSGNVELRMGRPSDYFFKIFTDGSANGTGDVSLLALKATGKFSFYTGGEAAGNKAGEISAAGAWTLGPLSSNNRNLLVNGHIRTNGKITGAGVDVPSGTNGPTAFLTENDVIKTSCTFLLVINTRSQSVPGKGATGLFAVSAHGAGTCNVILLSQTAIGGGNSLVAGAPGSGQIGIVGHDNAGTWELRWQNNTVGDNYSLSYEIVGGSD